jgi:Flp pilus assembly protein TadD
MTKAPLRVLALLLLCVLGTASAFLVVRRARGPSRLSEAELRARVQARPEDREAVDALARRYVDSGRPREAVTLLAAAVARSPGDAKLQNRLGVARAMLGERQAARLAFTHALALDPGLASAHGNRARLAFEEGDVATALRHGREAARLAPNDPERHRFLGEVLTEIRDYAGAAASFGTWARLQPRSREALAHLGEACVRAGRYAEGAAALRAARTQAPLDANASLLLGLALAEAPRGPEDEAEAQRLLQAAVAAGEDPLGWARYGLGLLASRRGRWNEAVVWFRAASDADPSAERPRYRLARALLKSGRRTEAQAALTDYDRLFRARRTVKGSSTENHGGTPH